MVTDEVEINEKAIKEFLKLLVVAYKEAEEEMLLADSYGVYQRKQIQREIKRVMTQLGEDADAFLSEQIPEHYRAGADTAVEQLSALDAPVRVAKNLSLIHKEAILALIDETGRLFGDAITGVYKTSQNILSEAVKREITERLAVGKISGATRQEITEEIKRIIKLEGIEALKDRSGKSWTLDRYADMLIKTKFVEARNRGFANRMVENGYDLVQVSDHRGECELCRPWEGRILSLRGKTKGFPTVDEAQNAGLFHPNCKHALNAVIPELALRTRAYSKETTKTVAEKDLRG